MLQSIRIESTLPLHTATRANWKLWANLFFREITSKLLYAYQIWSTWKALSLSWSVEQVMKVYLPARCLFQPNRFFREMAENKFYSNDSIVQFFSTNYFLIFFDADIDYVNIKSARFNWLHDFPCASSFTYALYCTSYTTNLLLNHISPLSTWRFKTWHVCLCLFLFLLHALSKFITLRTMSYFWQVLVFRLIINCDLSRS